MVGINLVKSMIPKVYATSRASMILLGAPGIGKSRIVRTCAELIAEALGKRFVEYDDEVASAILANPDRYFVFLDIRLTEHEPSDLTGIPRNDSDYVTFKPLKWAKVFSKASGILFLDELTNVEDPTMRGCSFKLLLDKAAGYIRFSPGVMVIAAGNTPEHSSIASNLAAPQINRAIVIDVEASDVMDWLAWLAREAEEGRHIDPEDVDELRKVMEIAEGWRRERRRGALYAIISAFLTYRRDALVTSPPPETMENFATPRTWEMLYKTLTDEYRRIFSVEEANAIAIGLLGRKLGSLFSVWLWKTPPRIEEVLENPDIVDRLDHETRILLAAYLGWFVRDRTDEIVKNHVLAEKVDAVIARMREYGNELIALMIYNIGRNPSEIVSKGLRLLSVLPSLKKFLKDASEVLFST